METPVASLLHKPSHRRRSSQTGVVLVLVLWVIALLTTIALAVSSTVKSESNLTRNRIDEARFRAVADAAVAYAVLRIGATEEDEQWLPDGSPNGWGLDDQRVQIQIFDEASRINLNGAPDALMQGLLEAVGLPAEEAEYVAKAIRDWRDADSSTDMGGAEDSDYRGAGYPFGSRDGSFHSVGELTQILGMPRELFAVLEPNLTVKLPVRPVVEEFAPPLVLQAMGKQGTATFAPAPADRDRDRDRDGRPRAPGKKGGPVYRIRIRAETGDSSPTAVYQIQTGGGGRQAGYVLLWRRYDWTGGEVSASEDG